MTSELRWNMGEKRSLFIILKKRAGTIRRVGKERKQRKGKKKEGWGIYILLRKKIQWNKFESFIFSQETLVGDEN